MSTEPARTIPSPTVEAEREVIAKAEAALDAGLGIEEDALEQWLDGLDRGEHASPSQALSRRAGYGQE